jgi:hypothetical protein
LKKLLIGFLLLAACTTRSTELPSTRTGPVPSGARPALDAFLGAIRSKDLQALGANWGDKDGPIRDSKRISRDELEKRELLLMCYFNHDSFTVLNDEAAAGGERKMTVRLTKGTLSRTTDFLLASASDRWYVRTGNVEPVRDLCSRK